MKRVNLFPLIVCMILLLGCQKNETDTDMANMDNTHQIVQINPDEIDIETLYSTTFLAPQDNKIAAKWLAIQDNKAVVYDTVPSVLAEQFEQHLDYLSLQFKEDKRIIANRVVQTRDLLEKFNIQVTLLALLEGMTTVRKSHLVGNFGDYCQFYINLRQHQHQHAQAIKKMQSLSIANKSQP
ncbi:MAG: hypothetical protein Q8R74_13330 [Methylophilus sp.]|nr:hypothetical protein [Methylophilus sp.]